MAGLQQLAEKYPGRSGRARLGLMIGMELAPTSRLLREGKTPAVRFTKSLHAAGLLAIPTTSQIIRFLPALNSARGG